MKKIFRILILILALSFTSVSAEVSQFVFTTDSQAIKPNETSSAITIQSQNNSGLSEPISETHDLEFTSTSPTGQFLNSSGNPVSTTMSRNTSNRTFYYKDSTEGIFIITVKATGRESQKSFTISQGITISNTAVVVEEEDEDSEDNDPDSSGGSSSNTQSSAHSSPAPLNTVKEKISLEVSAGRDRLATVGNKITFKATPVKATGIDSSSISYNWNFGDGSTGSGLNPSHSYEFPGEYIVVLNSTISDHQAVSRLKVTVVSPDIKINKIEGGVEIYQTSGAEINLGDWFLKGGSRQFAIPMDTLIPSGKKIILSDKLTGMSSGKIELYNPIGKLFASYGVEENLSNNSSEIVSGISLVDIENEVNKIQVALNDISSKVEPKPVLAVVPKVPTTPPVSRVTTLSVDYQENKEEAVSTSSTVAPENLVANSIEVFVAPEEKGMVSTIFAWPIRGFNFIKGIFVD